MNFTSWHIWFIIQFLVLFFVTSTLFYEFNCSAPAAWIQVVSFGVCFKSVASLCHPQYLLTTSTRSIPCAWNSWIWHFYLNNTLWPRRNLWNLVLATFRPESMKLTCLSRRFLARTFRPVVSEWRERTVVSQSWNSNWKGFLFGFQPFELSTHFESCAWRLQPHICSGLWKATIFDCVFVE